MTALKGNAIPVTSATSIISPATLSHVDLFEPTTLIEGLTLRNRVVMSPMTTYASTDNLHISAEEEPIIASARRVSD